MADLRYPNVGFIKGSTSINFYTELKVNQNGFIYDITQTEMFSSSEEPKEPEFYKDMLKEKFIETMGELKQESFTDRDLSVDQTDYDVSFEELEINLISLHNE
jgi:hypothetical protein